MSKSRLLQTYFNGVRWIAVWGLGCIYAEDKDFIRSVAISKARKRWNELIENMAKEGFPDQTPKP